MVEYQRHQGAVYILENPKAMRVKVGVTGNYTVNVIDRLKDANSKWLEKKATCQICGERRLINNRGFIPQHVVSGIKCSGGNELPLEKDVTLAMSHLDNMKVRLKELSGSEKGSATRIIKNLEKRISLYKHHKRPIGIWKLNTTFYTDNAEQVELLTHKILANHLDKEALFGEVFCCSVSDATVAVETALNQLGLLNSARKEVKKYVISEEYGECIICGNYLTKTGACPNCIQRYE